MATSEQNGMKRSIDDSVDDHPEGDDERPPANWTVGMADDCEACDDLRVVLTLEEARHGDRAASAQ